MSAKSADSIKVAIKVRPLLPKEKDQNCWWKVIQNSIQLVDSASEPYYFDYIFDQNAANEIIFDKMAKNIVHSALQGFNGTIFAYGQTSSGKTYTMMGDERNPGVMIMAVKEIFNEIQKATDRQFLLRVGYIEIYNEKIYDLLNKKNQDLKIHETPHGIVGVNCEDCIIMCEDDLLNCLNMGNKERTVGETNMNERSSRSHAIFRIIIESRKIDRSGDVIQSVLNLVDLAGSERADQTGARGTRLKEGGHINKSLLFLSNVIKRLSENEDDKYISYRDSKLTRILQASLGGNALTSIICTIKPNAIEETQSTLSFAMRAKSIKNKPQINEIISDATMMKRLEREIQDLKACLDEERRKNESKIKVGQLEERIKNEVLKIITCNSLSNIQTKREKRRRTWCGKSADIDVTTASNGCTTSGLPVSKFNVMSSSLHPSRLPKPLTHHTPLITMRPTPESERIQTVAEEDENFIPGELCTFSNSLLKTPESKTQHTHNHMLQVSITPIATALPANNLESMEHALKELQEFTNLETKIDVKHETYEALKQQLDCVMNRNKELERDRLELIALKDELVVVKDSLTDSEQRCDDLQIQISKLKNSNLKANEKIGKYETQLGELRQQIEKLEIENREAVSLDFEFQRHKNKAKLRENELLELVEEKQKELQKLEKALQNLNEQKTQDSKDELLHLSQSSELNDDESLCIKCIDLQRLLEENTKLLHELEKANLNYNQLELQLKQEENASGALQAKLASAELQLGEQQAACEHIAEFKQRQLNDAEQIARLRDEIAMLQVQLEQTQKENLALNSENNEKTVTTKDLQQLLDTTNAEMRMLNEKCSSLETACLERVQTIDTIQAQYDAIQAKYQKLQAEYEELEHTSSESRETCERLQRENSAIELEIAELKKRAELAQNELLSASDAERQAVDAERVAKLECELVNLQQQFEEMQNEYDDLSNQLMEGLQDNETLKNERNQLQSELQAMKAESAQANDCKALKERVAQLQHEINEKNALLSATERTVAEMQEQMKALQEELFEKSVYVEKCEEMRTQIQHLEKERAEMTMVCEVLQEKVKCSINDSSIFNETDETTITITKTNCFNSTSKAPADNEHTMELFNDTQPEQLTACDERLTELHEKLALILQLEQKLAAKEQEIKQLEQQLCDAQQANAQQAELMGKTHADALANLQLELLQKLEDSETQFRENLKKYNHDWEQQRDGFEKTIETLTAQLQQQSNGPTPEPLANGTMNGITAVDEGEAAVLPTDDSKVQPEDTRQLQMQIEQQAAEMKAAHDSLSECQAQLAAAEELQAALEAKNKSLSLELADCQQREQSQSAEFEMSVKALKDELNLTRQAQQESTAAAETLNEALLQAQAEHANAVQKNNELNERYAKLEQEMESKAAAHVEQLKQLEAMHEQQQQQYEKQLQQLRASKAELEVELAKHNEELQALSGKNVELSDDISKLRALNVEREEEAQRLKQQIESEKAKLKEAEATQASYESAIKEHEAQTLNMETEKSKLNEKIEALQLELENAKEENKTLEAAVEKLNPGMTDFSEAKIKLETELAAAKAHEQKLQADMAELRVEHAHAKQANEQLQEALAKLQLELDDLKLMKVQYAEQHEQESQELKYKNAEQQATLKAMETEIASLKLEHENAKREQENLQAVLAKLKQELTNASLTKTQYEEQLAAAKQYEQLSQELKAKNEQHQESIGALEAEIVSHKVELENVKKANEQLKATAQTLRQELEQHQEISRALEAEIVSHKVELENAKKASEQLEATVQTLRQELADAKRTKSEIEEQLTALKQYEQVSQELRKQNEEQQAAMASLSLAHATAEKANAEFQAEVQNFASAKQAHAQQIATLNGEIMELKMQLENINKHNANLRQSLEQLNAESATLQQTNEQLQTQLDLAKSGEQASNALLSKNEQLQQSLEHLQAENKLLSAANGKAKMELESAAAAQQQQQTQLASMRGEMQELRETIVRLHQEKQNLQTLSEQCVTEKSQLTAQATEFAHKLDSLQQQLHAARQKLQSSEQLLLEQADIEAALKHSKTEKLQLTNELNMLKTQLADSQTLGRACSNTATLQINNLEAQLKLASDRNGQLCAQEQRLNTNLKQLQTNYEQERATMTKQNQALLSSLDELKLKYKSLEDSKLCIEQRTKKLEQALEQSKLLVEASEKEFNAKQARLEGTIACLQTEEQALKEKLCLTEAILKKLEKDRERDSLSGALKKSASANSSFESTISDRQSPRLKGANEYPASKLSMERKNRRISVHDDNRRQSCWDSAQELELTNEAHECNCIEKDQKLQEYEKQLFIRESQVTALHLELKNHPLKEENAALIKRLKAEQDKYCMDVKRYKSKINDLSVKVNELTSVLASTPANDTAALAKSIKIVVNADTQTEFELDQCLQEMQRKYQLMKGICRSRYDKIRELEDNPQAQKENNDGNAALSSLEAGQLKALQTQCEVLKKELKQVQEKYKRAKQVLHMRREEIENLRQQLDQISTNATAL